MRTRVNLVVGAVLLLLSQLAALLAVGQTLVTGRGGPVGWTGGHPSPTQADSFSATAHTAANDDSPVFYPPRPATFVYFAGQNTAADVLTPAIDGVTPVCTLDGTNPQTNPCVSLQVSVSFPANNAGQYTMVIDGNLGGPPSPKKSHWAGIENTALLQVIETSDNATPMDNAAKQSTGAYLLLNDDNDNGRVNTGTQTIDNGLPPSSSNLGPNPTMDSTYNNQEVVLQPMPDYNAPIADAGVKGEKDLVRIIIEPNNDPISGASKGGTYKIDFNDSALKLWASPIKANVPIPGQTSFPKYQQIFPMSDPGKTATVFTNNSSGQTIDLYVEGITLSNSAADQEITLYWSPPSGNYTIVDHANFTVFSIEGPQYVPEYGKYKYVAYVPGGIPNGVAVNSVSNASSQTNTLYNDGTGDPSPASPAGVSWGPWNNVTNGFITADPLLFKDASAGHTGARGYVQFSPITGFVCKRYVYVVSVQVPASTAKVLTLARGGAPGVGNTVVSSNCQFNYSSTVSAHGLWDVNIGSQRGLQYMQIGYIQLVTATHYNGTSTAIGQWHAPMQGNQYVDLSTILGTGTPNSMSPWLDSQNTQGTQLPGLMPIVHTHNIWVFAPENDQKPVNYAFNDFDEPRANVFGPLTSYQISWDFDLSLSVRTLDRGGISGGGANQIYFKRADVTWHANFNQTPTYKSDSATFQTGGPVNGAEVVFPKPRAPAFNTCLFDFRTGTAPFAWAAGL